MLREERRQAYLKAMGISVLYPRRALAGARPSPSYELPPAGSDASSQKTAAKTGSSRPATPPSPARTRQQEVRSPGVVTGKASGQRQPAAQPKEPEVQSVDAEAGEQAPHFTLVWYAVSSQLALICELPQHASRSLKENSLALLQAILRALQIDVDLQGLPRAELQWPLHDGMSAAEASSKHATLALSGFITKHLEQRQPSNLLVFGEQIGELLPGAKTAGAVADYPLHSLAVHITRVSSLSAMLSMPELKRECWRDLQALRQRL